MDHIICWDYIVNRRSFINCSLAWANSKLPYPAQTPSYVIRFFLSDNAGNRVLEFELCGPSGFRVSGTDPRDRIRVNRKATPTLPSARDTRGCTENTWSCWKSCHPELPGTPRHLDAVRTKVLIRSVMLLIMYSLIMRHM